MNESFGLNLSLIVFGHYDNVCNVALTSVLLEHLNKILGLLLKLNLGEALGVCNKLACKSKKLTVLALTLGRGVFGLLFNLTAACNQKCIKRRLNCVVNAGTRVGCTADNLGCESIGSLTVVLTVLAGNNA